MLKNFPLELYTAVMGYFYFLSVSYLSTGQTNLYDGLFFASSLYLSYFFIVFLRKELFTHFLDHEAFSWQQVGLLKLLIGVLAIMVWLIFIPVLTPTKLFIFLLIFLLTLAYILKLRSYSYVKNLVIALVWTLLLHALIDLSPMLIFSCFMLIYSLAIFSDAKDIHMDRVDRIYSWYHLMGRKGTVGPCLCLIILSQAMLYQAALITIIQLLLLVLAASLVAFFIFVTRQSYVRLYILAELYFLIHYSIVIYFKD